MFAEGGRHRHVIPRWRSPFKAYAANEGRGDVDGDFPLRPDVVAREAEWMASPGLGRALDLIAAASTMPDPSPTAREAASWLLSEGRPSRLARIAAEQVLAPSDRAPFRSAPPEDEQPELRAQIARLRATAHSDPRNAIAWAEQARHYASLGQPEAALRAMRRALALAPAHRYFLRAAARLYVHTGECDRAHALLRASPRTAGDPWLLAAEIAVAEVADRSSRNVSSARRLLGDGGWGAWHKTELASALATLELKEGRERRARRLFDQSLNSPNDNALAQAEWVSDRLRGVKPRLAEARESVPRSFEALSLAAVAEGKIPDALAESWRWLLDQPFSAQPATFGSYHAGQIRDFERSLAFARRGVLANPVNSTLRNNAAFALAQLGRLPEAEDELAHVREAELDEHERSVIRATRGLIAFRSGDPERGRALYAEAIAGFGDPADRALATLMFVAEMLRLRLPGSSEAAARARSEAERRLAPRDQGWLGYLGEVSQ